MELFNRVGTTLFTLAAKYVVKMNDIPFSNTNLKHLFSTECIIYNTRLQDFGIKIFKVVGSQLKYYLWLALSFQTAIPKLNSNDSTKQDNNFVSK